MEENFEKTPVGKQPANCVISGADAPASLAVTAETAASGRHSLKFVDAAGLSQVWQPHLYYRNINFARGTLQVSFDLRVEKGAIVTVECRDASSPYRVGPSLTVTADGQLMAQKKPLMQAPQGQWFHVEARCPLGREANGSYDLLVKLRNGETKKFPALPCGHKDFNRLQWFGFMSNANGPAVYYVDNLKVTTVK